MLSELYLATEMMIMVLKDSPSFTHNISLWNKWIFVGITFPVFSSSEHKVLMVSYCDRSLSVRKSIRTSVNNCLKKRSPLKQHGQIQWNFTGSFLGCPSTKIQQEVSID